MARASPVWKKMLFGGFAESKPPKEGDWIVALPDDLPEVARTLLVIAHGRFDLELRQSPCHISLEELYKISIMTDKYDMTHIPMPWAPKWLEEFRLYYDFKSHLELLWVAWELGDKKRFVSAAS
ncbi:hypothetical protein PG994_002716 [Apiospora phragmitis]|uniref:BTB domain-containing protein n=1 Tax=Apiospora phragmitis TaxID=2905665 RepID=A0ABR1W5Y7_9PEZI